MEELDGGGVKIGRRSWTEEELNRSEELDGGGVKIGRRSRTEEELE